MILNDLNYSYKFFPLDQAIQGSLHDRMRWMLRNAL